MNKAAGIPDDFHARRPVDRVAAQVTARGFHYEPAKHVQTRDSDTPLAIREIQSVERNASGFINLAGMTFGRFVVLGISADYARHWVVRCSCGRYSTRTAKAIKNPENTQDRCEHCRHLAFLKREEAFRRTGRNQNIRNF